MGGVRIALPIIPTFHDPITPIFQPDLLYWLRLPGPGFVRWCPALHGFSGHGVLAPENPADRTAVRERRLPGRTSHPGPTPLNRLFSSPSFPCPLAPVCEVRKNGIDPFRLPRLLSFAILDETAKQWWVALVHRTGWAKWNGTQSRQQP